MYKLVPIFIFVLGLAKLSKSEPQCPNGWFKSKSHSLKFQSPDKSYCYFVGEKEMTYLDSREFCNDLPFNGTQLAEVDGDVLEFPNEIETNLKKEVNSCDKFPCKWWVAHMYEYHESESLYMQSCVELVHIEEGIFKLHFQGDCFNNRRPICEKQIDE